MPAKPTRVEVRVGELAVDIMLDMDMEFISDTAVLDWTRLCGCCEPDVIHAAYRILRSGDVVIDGGANTGYMALTFAAMVGVSGRVLAFEPEQDNVAKLYRNIELNKASQIDVIDRPLWRKEESVSLHFNPRDSGGHSLAPIGYETNHTMSMQSATIDSFKLKPRLIKLDIEGAEVAALAGAVETVRSCQPYIICEMNNGALVRFGESNNSLRDYAKQIFAYDTFLLLRTHAYPVLVPPGVTIVTPVDNTNILFATPEMVAAAFPWIHYQLPQNVIEYLQKCNA